MSSYIGKVQIGAGDQILIGSTLYGVCNTDANTAAKTVTLNSFNTLMNGITVHVRFVNGNNITTGMTLAVGSTSAQSIVGNCVCNANDIVAFTYWEEEINNILVKTWYVNSNVVAEESSTNGQIKINGQNVNIHGLSTAAYTESTAYATAAQGTLADNAMPKSGGTFTGAVTLNGAPTENLHAATKAYVDNEISTALTGSANAMVFKGTIGENGTINTTADPPQTLPTTGYNAGWTYRVITAGTYAGQVCEVGDLIIAIADAPSSGSGTNADWTVAQGNLDGTVFGPTSSTTNHVATFKDEFGKEIQDSGFTLGKSVPANAALTDTTYTITNGSAYTAHTLVTGIVNDNSTIASVSQGILTLASGITFTTGTVNATLNATTNPSS